LSLKSKVDDFSHFGIKTGGFGFPGLGLKIIVMISWFVPQNQVGYGLSVVPQNRQEDEDGMGHVSRSSDLLRLEANHVRISQSDLKTDIIMEVASC
jgi:hypothetical protein